MLESQTAPEVASDCQRLADFTSHDAKEMAKALESVAAWDCRAPNACWSMDASASGSPGLSVEHPPLAREHPAPASTCMPSPATLAAIVTSTARLWMGSRSKSPDAAPPASTMPAWSLEPLGSVESPSLPEAGAAAPRQPSLFLSASGAEEPETAPEEDPLDCSPEAGLSSCRPPCRSARSPRGRRSLSCASLLQRSAAPREEPAGSSPARPRGLPASCSALDVADAAAAEARFRSSAWPGPRSRRVRIPGPARDAEVVYVDSEAEEREIRSGAPASHGGQPDAAQPSRASWPSPSAVSGWLSAQVRRGMSTSGSLRRAALAAAAAARANVYAEPDGGAAAEADVRAERARARAQRRAQAAARGRRALEEGGEEVGALEREIGALRLENSELARRTRVFERILAVRDAMLAAFHAPEEEGLGASEGSGKEEGVAREHGPGAGGELASVPSFAPVVPPQRPAPPASPFPPSASAEASCAAAECVEFDPGVSAESSGSCADPSSDACAGPRVAALAPCCSLDLAGALPALPPGAPADAARLWQTWKAELRGFLQRARRQGRLRQAVKLAEGSMRQMMRCWGELTGQSGGPAADEEAAKRRWEQCARRLLPLVKPVALERLERALGAYSARLAALADRRGELAARLGALTPAALDPETFCHLTSARSVLAVGQAAAELSQLADEAWRSAASFFAAWTRCVGLYGAAMAHLDSAPYSCDWIAVAQSMLALRREGGEAEGVAMEVGGAGEA